MDVFGGRMTQAVLDTLQKKDHANRLKNLAEGRYLTLAKSSRNDPFISGS